MDIFNKKTNVGRPLTRANRVLVETAVNLGVDIERIPGVKRRFKMSYGNLTYTIRNGYIFSTLNDKLARRLCKRKNVTSSYLASIDIPAPVNAIFKDNELERAWSWAKFLLPVVLKPNDGKSGKNVYVNISNKNEFYELFNLIAQEHERVLVEQFCKGTDYRVLVVDNKVITCLKRIPANVVGDGINNINRLVHEKNKSRSGPVLKHLQLDKESQRNLDKLNYNFESIPKKDEIVFLRSNANISDGGDSYESTHEVPNSVISQIEKAIKAIPGLHVCGVDALIDGESLNIIELNGSPMIDIHYNTSCGNTVDVASDIIRTMFPSIK